MLLILWESAQTTLLKKSCPVFYMLNNWVALRTANFKNELNALPVCNENQENSLYLQQCNAPSPPDSHQLIITHDFTSIQQKQPQVWRKTWQAAGHVHKPNWDISVYTTVHREVKHSKIQRRTGLEVSFNSITCIEIT